MSETNYYCRRCGAETDETGDVVAVPASREGAFQYRVAPWMAACFTPEICSNTTERNHRFLEESLELVQSLGCTASEAHQLVDYVFGRPVGEPHQECGGVMVTIAALCLAAGLDMHDAGDDELARVWKKIDVIRTKQATKPKHSPLPAPPAAPAEPPTRDCNGRTFAEYAAAMRDEARPAEPQQAVAEVRNWNDKSAATYLGTVIHMLREVPIGTKLYAEPVSKAGDK